MQLYVFWASLYLGLMRLAAEAQWQQRQCAPPKAVKQLQAARHN
jgi:hypothetical protein